MYTIQDMIIFEEKILKETIKHIRECSRKDVISFNSPKESMETHFTINFFPDRNVVEKMNKIIEAFKQKYPELEYMDINNLHITIVGLIPLNIPVNNLKDFIAKNIKDGLRFKIKGMDTSNRSVSFLAFSQNTSLKIIREKFENEVTKDINKYTGRYKEIGWINFARFKTKPPMEFYDDLIKNISTEIGVTKGKIKILKNSSNMLTDAEVIFETY